MSSRPKSPTPLVPSTGSTEVNDGSGNEFLISKIDVLGSKAALYMWDPINRGWELWDQLLHASLTQRGEKMVYTGVSDRRSRTPGERMDPEASWIMSPEGCQTCG